MIAVIAALPREIAGLVGRLRPEQELVKRGVYLYKLGPAVAVAAGMGQGRATMAVDAALAAAPGAMLVSTGLAGSCSATVPAGVVAEAGVVVDALTGERFGANTAEKNVLVTAATIAGVEEKARLAATYGGAMVDMEAAAVARMAQARGVEFRAIKGISDAHDFEMESLARFAGNMGEFRTAAFALHTAFRPGSWRKAMTLGRHSQAALVELTERLRELIGV